MLIDLYTNILYSDPFSLVLVKLILAFSLLYLSMASSFYFFGKLGHQKGWTKPVSTLPLFKHQIRTEITYSFVSIVIFACYGVLTIWLYRQNLLEISFDNNWLILVDLFIFAIWNEVHFFAVHRLMHTKLLLPFHRIHHKSVVVTPFSTFSFHPVESFLMGSVMIIPMLFFPFEIYALILLPIYSLFFNTLGHSNIAFINQKNLISTQHNTHHTKFNFNFGFISHQLEKIFKRNPK